MNITDTTAHERSITCAVAQADLLRLVAEKVAQEANFNINDPVGVHVRAYISTSNRGGPGGPEYNVRVEIKHDLRSDAGPSTIRLS